MHTRTVFFISDGTGITAETFGNAILAQFDMKPRHVRLPFIDTVDKAFQAVRQINHTAEVEGRTLLVELLRENLGLTGTHVGCDTSQCGACVVHVDGKSVKSCTMLAAQADGTSVATIEGLAKSPTELHPMQEAFRDNHGLQCGFCTPGFIMATKALLDQNPNPTLKEIYDGHRWNICRCTGYTKIFAAVELAAQRMRSA